MDRLADNRRMSIDDRLVHRAYTLVEAGVPIDAAIEDLVTVAHGSSSSLEAACVKADRYSPIDVASGSEALELAGFDPDLGQLAGRRHGQISELLERAFRAVA